MMPARLLIIDDDVKLGSLLREYLEPFGYSVDLSHNGQDGLRQAIKAEYAAIILDVMLPGMSGYDVLRELRKQSSTPVLMFTALGAEPDRIAGLDVGADDYLPKTFSTSELLARLRALIRRSFLTESQHKELREDRRDLDQARTIQRALLPRAVPSVPGFEISGVWLPARTVSGDYYDVFQVGPDKLALCIGDVSGKGMPAALLMANVQAAVKAFGSEGISPDELCRRVNGILCGNTTDGRHMSFFYGVIDCKTRRLTYTCAGHNPPILIRHDRTEERMSKGGMVLGLFPKCEYERAELQLGAGDRIVLFTDGVTEATDSSEEEFGEPRLLQILRGQPASSAETVQKAVIDAVSEFSNGVFQDDVTLLVVRVCD